MLNPILVTAAFRAKVRVGFTDKNAETRNPSVAELKIMTEGVTAMVKLSGGEVIRTNKKSIEGTTEKLRIFEINIPEDAFDKLKSNIAKIKDSAVNDTAHSTHTPIYMPKFVGLIKN